jgi:hypothetical protein
VSEPGAPENPRAAPPGVAGIRTASEQSYLIVSDALQTIAETAISEALAEDCRSLLESAPFVVRYGEMGEPIRCECCGTLVGLVPEGEAERHWRDRVWLPAIWETGLARKHTFRRCSWLREHPEPASAGGK